jgi:hypothetical protein
MPELPLSISTVSHKGWLEKPADLEAAVEDLREHRLGIAFRVGTPEWVDPITIVNFAHDHRDIPVTIETGLDLSQMEEEGILEAYGVLCDAFFAAKYTHIGYTGDLACMKRTPIVRGVFYDKDLLGEKDHHSLYEVLAKRLAIFDGMCQSACVDIALENMPWLSASDLAGLADTLSQADNIRLLMDIGNGPNGQEFGTVMTPQETLGYCHANTEIIATYHLKQPGVVNTPNRLNVLNPNGGFNMQSVVDLIATTQLRGPVVMEPPESTLEQAKDDAAFLRSLRYEP